MNLIILKQQDFVTETQAKLSDRRFEHLVNVQKVKINDILRAGLFNGDMGTARVVKADAHEIILETQLDTPAPAGLPVTLILALPRPKMLRRILQTTATMGVKQLHLINSYRVEKSFWQSPWLEPEAIEEQLLLGLEQGVDTVMPDVTLHKRFKPFVEDILPGISANTHGLVAHPGEHEACPVNLCPSKTVTLAIGPEGGFIPYEVEKLSEAGLLPVSLGNRILRVETAVPVLISSLFHAHI